MNQGSINSKQSSNDKFDFHRLNPNAFQTLDAPVNSFVFIEDVTSDLLYGDPEKGQNPLFSVVIPTFNREDLFREALESALAQEHTDFPWELLVVDNTPADAQGMTPALKVVRELGNPSVLYYRNRVNIGTGYNWNRGAELARGEWVVFLHDDDILYPDALSNLARIIRSQSSGKKPLGYVHARRDLFSDSAELPNLQHSKANYFAPLTRTGALFRGESGTGMPSCGTAILKKAYLEAGGINYDFGLTADAILGYQIMKDYRVIVSDCALGAYRWAENETLRKSSLLGLVHSDYLFAQYRYSLSPFSRLWGRLFWRAEHNENMGYKIKDGKRKDILLSPQDFDFIVPYRPTNGFLSILHRALRKLYFGLSNLKAKLQYS